MLTLLFYLIACQCSIKHVTFKTFQLKSIYVLVHYNDPREIKSVQFIKQLEKNINSIEKIMPDLQIMNLMLSENGRDDHNIPHQIFYPYFELFYQQIKVDSIQNVQSIQQLLKWVNKKLHHSHQIINDTNSLSNFNDHTRIIVNSSIFAQQLLKSLYHEDVIIFYNSTFRNLLVYPAYEETPIIVQNTSQLLQNIHPKILTPEQHNYAKNIRHQHKKQIGLVVRQLENHFIDQFIEQVHHSLDDDFQYIICPIDFYECDQYLHEIGLDQERIPYLFVLSTNTKQMQKKHTMHISKIELESFKQLFYSGSLDELKIKEIDYSGFEIIRPTAEDYNQYKTLAGSELEPIQQLDENQFQSLMGNKSHSIIIIHDSRSNCFSCRYYETLLMKLRIYLYENYQFKFLIGEVNLRTTEVEAQVYIPLDAYPAIILYSKKNPINLTKFLQRGKEDFENILYRLQDAFEMKFSQTTGYLLKQASIPNVQKDKIQEHGEIMGGIDLNEFVKLNLRDDL